MRYDIYMWDRYGNYWVIVNCIVEISWFVKSFGKWQWVIYSCECLDSGMYFGVYGELMGCFLGLGMELVEIECNL